MLFIPVHPVEREIHRPFEREPVPDDSLGVQRRDGTQRELPRMKFGECLCLLDELGVVGIVVSQDPHAAAALEHLAGATAVMIDKTGTLTEGKPRVVDIQAAVEVVLPDGSVELLGGLEPDRPGLHLTAFRMYPDSAGIIRLRPRGSKQSVVNIHLTAAEAKQLSGVFGRIADALEPSTLEEKGR